MEVYNWMAVDDDQFFFAMFFFNKETKDRKNLGLELHDVRFALRRLIVHPEKSDGKKMSGFIPIDQHDLKDHGNIINWRDLTVPESPKSDLTTDAERENFTLIYN